VPGTAGAAASTIDPALAPSADHLDLQAAGLHGSRSLGLERIER
jgi:hypothetical protein